MSAAGKSLAIIGAGLFVLGAAFALLPGTMLPLMGFEVAGEPWIRVLGLVVAALGSIYVVAARAEDVAVLQASIFVRTAVGVGFGLLVLLGIAPLPLLVFVGLEFGGAAWTYYALRRTPPNLRRSSMST